MTISLRLLILEDEPYDAELEIAALEEAGYACDWQRVETRDQFLASLDTGAHDLILADYSLPTFDGLTALKLCVARARHPPFILISGTLGEEVAIESLKAGATDYVLKDRISRLGPAVTRALDEKRLRDEKQRAEAALRESEGRYRALYEDNPSMYFTVDVNGTVLSVNKFGAQQLGYTVDELVGQPVLNVFYEEDKEAVRQQAAICLQNPSTVAHWEFRKVRKDGSMLWVEERVRVTRDTAGRVVLLIVCDDITERKRAEQALRRYAQRLESLTEIDRAILSAQSPQQIASAVLSHLSHLVPCQDASVTLFDFDRGEARIVARRRPDDTETPESVTPIDDRPPRSAPRQGPVQYVVDIAAVKHRPVLLNRLLDAGVRSFVSAPLFVEGELIGELNLDADRPAAFGSEHLEIARALADQLSVALQQARLREELQRHTLELEQRVVERTRELAEANERLTELDRLKSKFVSDVSHELRTPVTNLSLYLGLLEHGKPEKFEEYVAILNQQAGRLIRLIEDILDLSRLEAAQAALTYAPVDLNAVAEQVVVAHRPRAEAARLNLRFDFDPDLPPVQAARDQLIQVVTNLVANAVNYTQAGEVRVSTYRQAARVCLEVRDTGIGIAPEDVPHLFERFYRGRRTGQLDIPGTGLGLAIVKDIVELHGGSVEVESRPGAGSVFRVWLPLNVERPAARPGVT